MNKSDYQKHLTNLQIELVKLQHWVKLKNLKVVVIFEGRDASGKGGMIKTISEKLNPRQVKTIALPAPTEREKTQWYFQRYVQHLPAAGEICLFDRSWYNRAGVEKVMGFCSDEEYSYFLTNCAHFEKMLIDSGIILIKYWLSVSADEQEKRFRSRLNDPIKRWKFSQMDLKAREKWADYSQAKLAMLAATDTKASPWHMVEADNKKLARLNCISHLLSQFDYQETSFEYIQLPKVEKTGYSDSKPASSKYIAKQYK